MDVYTELEDVEDVVEESGADTLEQLDEVESVTSVLQQNVLPLGPAYGRDPEFWRHIFMCLVFGGVLGLVGFGYLEAIERVQELWWGDDYGKSSSSTKLGSGNLNWLVIMSLGGFGVGVLKVLIQFPPVVHGFFNEVQSQHVHPADAPKIVIVSLASLMMGASMGPEAALGSLGGGLAQLWSDKRHLSVRMTEQNVINGIAAAIGPLFPSPAIAVCCLAEIGRVDTMHHSYMRALAMMGVASSASFAVYFNLKETSFLPFNPLSLAYRFQSGDQLVALCIGVVGGVVGTLHIVLVGIVSKLLVRIGSLLPRHVGTVLMTTIGGLLLGLLALAAPLTLGSGSKQSQDVVKLVIKNELGSTDLLVTALLKSIAFGVSKGSGFVGGAIFPLIFIGSCVGLGAWSLLYGHLEVDSSDLDKAGRLGLFLMCFMVAVPASVMPAPLTLLLLVAFTFQLSAYQATPIFVACIGAHLTGAGSGVLHALMDRFRPPPKE